MATFKSDDLLNLLPGIILQARNALANLRLAQEQLAPPEAREADVELDRQAAVLDQSCCRLLWLTNNLNALLSLARSPEPVLRDVDLAARVGELCEQAAGLGETMGLKLRFLCAQERLLCAVEWSSLECILLHLLANAFRFTPEGGTVTVNLRPLGPKVLLSVHDSGPGISDDQREKIFTTQPPSSGASPFQESGMGLPLCKFLAQRQGAALLAESLPKGHGACFTLSLIARTTGDLSETLQDFSGGISSVLLGLSGALPSRAFQLGNH